VLVRIDRAGHPRAEVAGQTEGVQPAVGVACRYHRAVQPPKWQGNSIYKAVEAGGLKMIECGFPSGDGGWRVTHLPSGSYFHIDRVHGGSSYKLTSVVGDTSPWRTESFSWQPVTEKIKRWAQDVTQDVDDPDLWDELRRSQRIVTGVGYDDSDNTVFTQSEQAQIVEALQEVKEFVRSTTSLPEPQLRVIEEKLDELAAAAGRVGRKDWRLMFAGTVLAVIIGNLLPREVLFHILAMAANGLGHLFGDGGGPVPRLPM